MRNNTSHLKIEFLLICLTVWATSEMVPQTPGLTVRPGVGVQDVNGGIARFGDPTAFHLALDGDDIQAKSATQSFSLLDINYYGGDVRIGGAANPFYFNSNTGWIGMNTDKPDGPLDIDFGATGSLIASTPGGNGPGWLYFASDGDRWDTFAWVNGFQIRKDGTNSVFQFGDDGRMGIGTTSPDGALDIDFGATGSVVASTPGGNGPGWLITSSNGIRWDVYATIDGFNIWRNGTSSNMYLSNAGRLGIKLGNGSAGSDIHLKQASGNTYSTNGLRLEYGDNANFWNTLIDVGNDYLLAYNGSWRVWFSETDGSYNQSSDRKVKQDIKKVPDLLDRVMQLRPVSYKYRDYPDAARRSWGFVAQDVEPLFPDFVSEKKGIKGLAYDNFAVVAIKAIQELKGTIDRRDKEVDALKENVELLQSQVEELLAGVADPDPDNSYTLRLEPEALLAQNQPNPFRAQTRIRFVIPGQVKDAQIRITGTDGSLLREVNIDKPGSGHLDIDAAYFAAGTYYYSLILDGQVFATRPMVLKH